MHPPVKAASGELAGQRLEEFDAWIAATALRFSLPLATNNRKHFDGIAGLTLVGGIAIE